MLSTVAALALCALSPDHAPDVVAFVGVHVVPMDAEVVLRDRTVVVTDGVITAIGGAAELETPAGAVVIEGQGRYLMPGLADMHVHCWSTSDHALFVANGVTTVRNMWGGAGQLAWRAKADAREPEFLGPTFYTAGTLLDGAPPIWPTSLALTEVDAARAEVARQVERGFHFIKVYSRLSAPVYEALVSAAEELGIPVVGHVPEAVGLEGVLEARQSSIEHADGYVDRSGAAPDPEQLARAPELRYVAPATRRSWNPANDFRFQSADSERYERLRATFEHAQAVTRALHEGGCRLLLGTDTPNPFVVPGFSIHEELAHLVACGLSPYEALRAGSADAAEYLGAPGEFGVVAVGARADLVLLEADPLEDVAHFARRAGVMLRGRWYPESALKTRLEQLADKFAPRSGEGR